MKVHPTDLDGVLLIEPDIYPDDRGHFLETWHARRYHGHGLPERFVQDNVSFSRKGVLRGLHFQNPHPQGKLISTLQGEIFDVAVDLRNNAPTFGRWTAAILSDANGRQLYVPEGFAHGFVVLSETALVHYKCTDYYAPASDGALRWDDPDLAIEWPVKTPILSPKDAAAPYLKDLPEARLF